MDDHERSELVSGTLCAHQTGRKSWSCNPFQLWINYIIKSLAFGIPGAIWLLAIFHLLARDVIVNPQFLGIGCLQIALFELNAVDPVRASVKDVIAVGLAFSNTADLVQGLERFALVGKVGLECFVAATALLDSG